MANKLEANGWNGMGNATMLATDFSKISTAGPAYIVFGIPT